MVSPPGSVPCFTPSVRICYQNILPVISNNLTSAFPPAHSEGFVCLNNSQTDLQAAAGRENLTHNPDDVPLNLYCIVFLLTAVLWLGLRPSAVQVKVVAS